MIVLLLFHITFTEPCFRGDKTKQNLSGTVRKLLGSPESLILVLSPDLGASVE